MSTTSHKSNAMRILDAAKVRYRSYTLDLDGAKSGVDVAHLLEVEEERVFKTLVTQGKSHNHYVFLVPAPKALDLKKAAAAVGEKSISMIREKELFPLTGYVHGGCSPLGMKKAFPTIIDETAVLFDTILFSGGKIGLQIELDVTDLKQVLDYSLADITTNA